MMVLRPGQGNLRQVFRLFSLRFPCRGLNTIIDYFSHTSSFSLFPQQKNKKAIFSDIVTKIKSTVRLFADNTSLYLIVDGPIEAARCLNSDLELIYQWAECWLVKFNAAESELLLVTRPNDNHSPGPVIREVSP